MAQFESGTIVLGKVCGYPWWPALLLCRRTDANNFQLPHFNAEWKRGHYVLYFLDVLNAVAVSRGDAEASICMYDPDDVEKKAATIKKKYRNRYRLARTKASLYMSLPKVRRRGLAMHQHFI